MERRKFMKWAGGGALGLLGGAGILFARKTREVALPDEPLEYFTAREYAIFTAVAEAMVGVPEGQPTVQELNVALIADRTMARNPIDAREDFRRLLALFDNALAGFFLTGRIAPFSQMSIAGRQKVLRIWQHHRIGALRSGFSAMKRLSMSCYYANPETYRAVGYPGPPELAPVEEEL